MGALRTGDTGATWSPKEIETARWFLARIGLKSSDLVNAEATSRHMPTLEEYLSRVWDASPEGTRRAYGPYWNRIRERWGHRKLDAPSPSEIREFAEHVKRNVVSRRNSRGGRGAAEHVISAFRCLYKHAVADGLIAEADDPACRVPKPRRAPSTRRGLSEDKLWEITQVAASTGNDPALDALLLRLHTETACRRGGALALRRRDIDDRHCLIFLVEKGGTVRWQPISPTLMRHLLLHADSRGHVEPEAQLLRYANGNPITYRRYDHLWSRLGKDLPWVATQQISTHWLRHTTLTWVERHFGYAVARAFAGHNDSGSAGTTTTYVRANIVEVATAVQALTGERHPVAHSERRTTR